MRGNFIALVFLLEIACNIIVLSHQTRSNCSLTFLQYESSHEEKKWFEKVHLWEKATCSYISNITVETYLNDIKTINSAALTRKSTEFSRNSMFDSRHISHYRYSWKCLGFKKKVVSVPIEGVIGLARDPRKCWNVYSDDYTNSKEYLIPMSHNYYHFFANKSNGTNYLFDAGASDYSTSLNRSSMKWLVDTYDGLGIRFDRLIAWEKRNMSKSQMYDGVPDWLLPGYEYHNYGIESKLNSSKNPLTLIKLLCKPSDFVVFKLDIDNKRIEMSLMEQIMLDPVLLALIDEFYYEHHFRDSAMAMHGWMSFTTTLSELYQLIIPMRSKGFRFHYWP